MTASFKEKFNRQLTSCRERSCPQRNMKGRLTRSESDASLVSSTLPTINEDLKDIKSLSSNDDVFTQIRPVSCDVHCSDNLFLPPLSNQLDNYGSRIAHTAHAYKKRPSTPRPLWTSKSFESIAMNKRFHNNSRFVSNSTSIRDGNETRNVRATPDKKSPNLEEFDKTPPTSPLRLASKCSTQGMKQETVPRSKPTTCLNRQKMDSNQIMSTSSRKI